MTRALRVLLLAFLTLGAVAGPAPAEDQSPARRLVASRWGLVRVDGSSVPQRTGVVIAFSAAGRVTGSSGCNDLEGSWTYLGGDGISIGDVAATREPCTDGPGRTERRFLDALILATTFIIDGSRLRVRTTDHGELVFRALGRTGSELGGEWLLASIDGTPAADIPRSSVSFADDGTLAGDGGCNAFRGGFSIRDDAIRVRRLLTGRATCATHVTDQETGFLDALQDAGSWSVAGDTLTLADTRGRHPITLRAVRPASHTLTDTDWTIASISDGATAAAGSTIRFWADGTLSGWGGCNTFRGPWTLDDDGIVLQLGPLMATRTRCAWEGLHLEAAYLTTLEDVIGYKTPGGAELWLTTASGVRVTYSPPVVPTLTGGGWHLAMVGDVPFEDQAPVSITFSDDATFVGNGGCDLFWGTFELRGDAFRVIDVESGDRACETAVRDLQGSFLGLLPVLDRMAFDGPDLLLYAGTQAIRFSP
jgi:heat shock protein HslJ